MRRFYGSGKFFASMTNIATQKQSYIAVQQHQQANRRLKEVPDHKKKGDATVNKRTQYTSRHSIGVTTSGGAAHLQSVSHMLELEAQGYNAGQPRHQSSRRTLKDKMLSAEMDAPPPTPPSFVPHKSRIDTARAKAPSLKAVWNATDNWCSLCKEPLNSWNEHRGKRDHVCLEMFYDQLVEYGSNWSCTARRDAHMYFSERIFSTDKCMATFAQDEQKRRAELLLILKYLFDEGLLKRGKQFSASNEFNSAQMHGALALYKHQYIPIAAMFPHATAADCSCLSQMCASLYNMETVFDLCGLRELVGNDAPVQGTIMTPKGEVSDVGYTYKGTFLRSIIGQLRFALDPGSVEPPRYEKKSKFGFVESTTPGVSKKKRSGRGVMGVGGSSGGGGEPVPPHLELLAKIACKTLIAEMVFCRTCEFICRVEPVWRDHVNSANPPSPANNLPGTLPPKLTNYGAYCYLDGALHNPVVVEYPSATELKKMNASNEKTADCDETVGADVAQRLAATRGMPRLTMTSGGRYGKLAPQQAKKGK